MVARARTRRPAPPPRREAAPAARGWWRDGLVVAIAIAAYVTALPNGFVWDDDNLIVANPLIKSWSFLPQLLSSPLQPNTLYYRPLQGLVFLVEYRTFGLWPAGFHAVSVLLHAAVGVLLYRLAARVLADPDAALAAALLFVVHPVHTEAVTYLSGLSDPLSAVWLLLALLWSVTPGRRPLSVLAFLLAVLARESAIGLVPLFVLVDLTVSERRGDRLAHGWGLRALAHCLPYVVGVALYLPVRHLALGGATAARSMIDAPLLDRMLTMSIAVVRYLGILLFPAALHMERSLPVATSPFDPAVLASIALLAAITTLVVRLRRRAWPIAFAWTWFALALLPVANVVPLSTFMAEHWLYVPSMGLCIAAGWALTRLAVRAGRPTATAVLAMLVLCFGARTAWRNLDWRDGATIYQATLRFVPDRARLHTNLGRIHWMAGDSEAALREFAVAIALAPNDWQTADAHSNRGIILVQRNQGEAALADFRRAIELAPQNPAHYINLSLALQAVGRMGDGRRALLDALKLDPNNATAHSNLGNLAFNTGDLQTAGREYLLAIQLDPELADAHNNLGSVYLNQGQLDLAERSYRTALALAPNNDMARRNLEALMKARAAGR